MLAGLIAASTDVRCKALNHDSGRPLRDSLSFLTTLGAEVGDEEHEEKEDAIVLLVMRAARGGQSGRDA